MSSEVPSVINYAFISDLLRAYYGADGPSFSDCMRQVEQAVRAQWAAEVGRLETDNAICRDAIGHALELVEAFAASPEGDDDMSQGAARATRRRLNEALGKMAPRLMMERELSPKYGLHWKALRAERDSAQAEAKALRGALETAVAALADGLWDYGPGQDEHDKCEEVLAFCRAALQLGDSSHDE